MGSAQAISYAWRSLRRAPLFCSSVVLTLTIGIGSAAAIFAIVNAVLVRALPYGRPDRLVGVWNDMAPIPLISEGLWRSRFGSDKNVIGKKLVVSGNSTEIIGVMPERFHFPSAHTQLWLPLQLDPNEPYSEGFNYNSIARLRPGVSPGDA